MVSRYGDLVASVYVVMSRAMGDLALMSHEPDIIFSGSVTEVAWGHVELSSHGYTISGQRTASQTVSKMFTEASC